MKSCKGDKHLSVCTCLGPEIFLLHPGSEGSSCNTSNPSARLSCPVRPNTSHSGSAVWGCQYWPNHSLAFCCLGTSVLLCHPGSLATLLGTNKKLKSTTFLGNFTSILLLKRKPTKYLFSHSVPSHYFLTLRRASHLLYNVKEVVIITLSPGFCKCLDIM